MSSKPENNTPEGNSNFGLPEGYFQKSAGSVMNKIEWLEEHKNFPTLEKLRDKSCFKTPVGYFNTLEQKLELLDYPVLNSLGKQTVFLIPEDYFLSTEVRELSKVLDDHENKLAFIPKQNNFKVEENYFSENKEHLEQLLLNNKKPSRIVVLFSVRKWMAAAALLVVALGFWIYNLYFAPAQVKDCGTMACIDKAELLKSRNLENLETDELYELVNTKQLEQKLEKKSDAQKNDKKDDSLSKDAEDYLLDEI